MRDLLTKLADQGLWTHLLINCFMDSRIHRFYFRHLLSPIAKWQPLLLRAFQRWKSVPVGIWTTQGRCTKRSVMVQWSIWSVFHISDDFKYAPIYVDRHPDAVNLWIGNGRSTTSIHSGECVLPLFPQIPGSIMLLRTDHIQWLDPYENIYTVVRGEKRFTLLPPSDGWCLKGLLSVSPYPASKRNHPCAAWNRTSLSTCYVYQVSGLDFSWNKPFKKCVTSSMVINPRSKFTERSSSRRITYSRSSTTRGNTISPSWLVALCRASERNNYCHQLVVWHGNAWNALGISQSLEESRWPLYQWWRRWCMYKIISLSARHSDDIIR